MTTDLKINDTEFSQLRELIEQVCGISLGDEKTYLVENRLTKLVLENGCETFGQFYQKAKNPTDISLRSKIIDAVTTKETLWFRDEFPYALLREEFFPTLLDKISKGEKQKIRIWSAASSTGQEPYSIAMTAHEYAAKTGDRRLIEGKLNIVATDISMAAIFLAKAARYDSISMSRGMPDALKNKYFEEQGRVWALKDDIKKMVEFRQFNLQDNFVTLGMFDIIFIRNVAIYFSPEFKKGLFKKISQILSPDGYLMLGASESLVNYSNDFDSVMKTDRGMYYKLKQPL